LTKQIYSTSTLIKPCVLEGLDFLPYTLHESIIALKLKIQITAQKLNR